MYFKHLLRDTDNLGGMSFVVDKKTFTIMELVLF